jgi:hypothetical protein
VNRLLIGRLLLSVESIVHGNHGTYQTSSPSSHNIFWVACRSINGILLFKVVSRFLTKCRQIIGTYDSVSISHGACQPNSLQIELCSPRVEFSKPVAYRSSSPHATPVPKAIQTDREKPTSNRFAELNTGRAEFNLHFFVNGTEQSVNSCLVPHTFSSWLVAALPNKPGSVSLSPWKKERAGCLPC